MAFISASGTGSAGPTRGSAISRSLAALACLGLLPGAAPAGTSLDVEITALRSTKGMVRLCLTREAGDFPDCRDAASAIKRSFPAAAPRLRIEGLAPGSYAIAVIHDENANEKLDTFAGIPREGFGFSRNPAIGFGPPSFARAEFRIAADAAAQQVRMRYLL